MLTLGMGARITEKQALPRMLPRAMQTGRVQNACYGKAAEVIAKLCQVDLATARRWKAGKCRIPYAAQVLLLGDLSAFSKFWDGWIIQGEDIVSPDGWTINRNKALSVPLYEAQIRDRDGRIKALEAEIAYLKDVGKLEEQPAPPESLPSIA